MVDAAAPKVLVVEDDAGVAAGIVRGLSTAGFSVELATDGAEGARKALLEPFDAILLDLGLPRQDGFELLRQLQGRHRAPVLVLTARTELDARLRCFELGAVDFVSKPFWIEEVVARLRTHLRRRAELPGRLVEFAVAKVDLDRRTVTVEGAPIELTKHEFDVLAYLLERPGRAISRAQLAEHVLSPFDTPEERTVDSHVARIRKKLGARAAAHVATVWGIGYRFDEHAAKAPSPVSSR